MANATKSIDNEVIQVELSTGATLPFRPTTAAKSGNVYHATLATKASGVRYFPGKYGVNVEPAVVGGDLPKTCKVGGQTITFDKGTTQSGNPKVSASAVVTIDGNERVLRLRISRLANGNYNVSGSLTRQGGSGAIGKTVAAL